MEPSACINKYFLILIFPVNPLCLLFSNTYNKMDRHRITVNVAINQLIRNLDTAQLHKLYRNVCNRTNYFDKLPDDLIRYIFEFLGVVEYESHNLRICRRWSMIRDRVVRIHGLYLYSTDRDVQELLKKGCSSITTTELSFTADINHSNIKSLRMTEDMEVDSDKFPNLQTIHLFRMFPELVSFTKLTTVKFFSYTKEDLGVLNLIETLMTLEISKDILAGNRPHLFLKHLRDLTIHGKSAKDALIDDDIDNSKWPNLQRLRLANVLLKAQAMFVGCVHLDSITLEISSKSYVPQWWLPHVRATVGDFANHCDPGKLTNLVDVSTSVRTIDILGNEFKQRLTRLKIDCGLLWLRSNIHLFSKLGKLDIYFAPDAAQQQFIVVTKNLPALQQLDVHCCTVAVLRLLFPLSRLTALHLRSSVLDGPSMLSLPVLTPKLRTLRLQPGCCSVTDITHLFCFDWCPEISS